MPPKMFSIFNYFYCLGALHGSAEKDYRNPKGDKAAEALRLGGYFL